MKMSRCVALGKTLASLAFKWGTCEIKGRERADKPKPLMAFRRFRL
jgi:hypothetical protein